jgi:thiazole/oxazole-forming peptide maturase SagD family component
MECFAVERTAHALGTKIDRLMRRMVSPITGLDKTIGFSLHDQGSHGLFVSVAQLTAVHRLLGMARPLAYHLGGYGLRREEALIRALGETTERYSHMVCLVAGDRPLKFQSANSLRAEGFEVMELGDWGFFGEEEYAKPSTPYQRYSPDAPISWLETWSLTEDRAVWVPAMLLVIGYRRRKKDGELALAPAMTTGSAAHTIPERALNSAMLELIQMDAAVGFWYSGRIAPEIELDERLPDLAQILRETRGRAFDACFHYLQSPGFGVHVVACVMRSRRRDLPAAGVGVACEISLESACYKAFLEASAIPHLAQIGFLNAPAILRGVEKIDPTAIDDLDSNVLYYALPQNLPLVDRRFSREERLRASALPRYPAMNERELTRYLLDSYKENGCRLYYLELSTRDVRDLGFYVCRTYTPDLLSLCMPSSPQSGHPRFKSYGDVIVSDPHPFP